MFRGTLIPFFEGGSSRSSEELRVSSENVLKFEASHGVLLHSVLSRGRVI